MYNKPKKGMISILQKNINILCKLNLTHNSISVNDIVKSISYQFKNLTINIIEKTIEDFQNDFLDKILGKKWSNINDKITPWICPNCCERSSFVRRGSRKRKLKTSQGNITFNLSQITCKSCSKTYSPFLEILGIRERSRISIEFEEKIVSLALSNSYSKSAQYIQNLTNSTISHTSIRNIITRVSKSIKINNEIKEFDTILIDGTKIKSGTKDRGSNVHLALAPVQQIIKNGRKYNIKKLLSFGFANPYKTFKRELSQYSCKNIIMDGDSAYSTIAKALFPFSNRRRCLWHIPKNFSHLLYLNHVPVKDRQSLVMALVLILKNQNFYKSISEYMYFIRVFEKLQYTNIVNYLKNSMQGIYISRIDWENSEKHTSNSLIEREMQEINKRTDNGCRWSEIGVFNLVKLIEINKYASHNWDQYFKQNRRALIPMLELSIE